MSKKILIVDDEEDLSRLYQDTFTEMGYRVEVCHNAQEALASTQKETPDLVVLDIRMPGMDGIELLGVLTQSNPTLPVVLNTAHPALKENYLTWPAVAYLLKKGDLGELTQTVEKLMA